MYCLAKIVILYLKSERYMYKKLISSIICFLFCASTVNAQEVARLYLVKNANKADVENLIDIHLNENKLTFVKKNSYFISPDKGEHYEILLTKTADDDCYLYYQTNIEKTKTDKTLVGSIKASKYKTKKINNNDLIKVFSSDANAFKNRMSKFKIGNNKELTYDFSDDAQEEYENSKKNMDGVKVKINKVVSTNKSVLASPTNQPITNYPLAKTEPVQGVLKGIITQVPAGTAFDATLQSTVNSGSLDKNDKITAVLDSDWIYKGLLIAPAGSILYGKATAAKKAGLAYGSGSMELTFNELMTPKGTKIALTTNKVFLKAESQRAIKILVNVVVGAALGAAVAGVFLLCNDGKNAGKAMAIGLGSGAVAGSAYAISQKGENAEIPEGERLQIKLIQPMTVSPYN